MRPDRRLWLAIVGVGLGLALWLGLTVVLVWTTLAADEKAIVDTILGPRLGLLGLSWALAVAGVAVGLNQLYQRYAYAPARLLEKTRVLLAAIDPQPLTPAGSTEIKGLGAAINELAAQRDHLRADMAQQIAQASGHVQQERNRLAALMAELSQSVVVCNLDGRILLYNSRARLQFKTLSDAPALADGVELIGIGRSVYAVFDRKLVAHALESIYQRLARGAGSPSAQFVTTTRSGQLLRVQMAPVRASSGDPDSVSTELSGFVLMLENVTRSFEEGNLRDQLLHGLTERSRSSLANMQAAVDMLSLPDLEPVMRERFLSVVRDEVGLMSKRVTDLAQQSAQGLSTRWPMEQMLGTDFLLAAQRRMETQCERSVSLDSVDASVWLRVDSFTLIQALSYLAIRLVDEFEVKFLRLRLQTVQGRAQLDLIWTGQAMSTETVMSWEMESMRFGAESTPLTVRDVVGRHGGEMWFERERIRHEAFFRFLLPLADAQEQLEAAQQVRHHASRPEFYDFDLFKVSEGGHALDDRPLSSLTYTVFDTETTGLNPSGGDEIIQIGAARIVNGKLLRQESFEQLVDPQRMIPAATIPIHGITQDMVRGQPTLGAVLPVFHGFAQDTVLVAHNAAFDMKFLQLKEAETGLVFHHPVLDTLLLSAVVHPNQESHRLEAIAERFNIAVLGRHTALGDAMVTAEIWLRLIPLLQGMGIHTLRQAREAAQKTYYARLTY